MQYFYSCYKIRCGVAQDTDMYSFDMIVFTDNL